MAIEAPQKVVTTPVTTTVPAAQAATTTTTSTPKKEETAGTIGTAPVKTNPQLAKKLDVMA